MKVKELCDGYKAIALEAAKADYLKKNIKIRQYVPYAEKVNELRGLVIASHIRDDGEIIMNSPKQYLCNMLAIMILYTDLEVNKDNWTEEYDMLREARLMDPILDMIPGDDLQEFDILRKMILDDFLDNEASARSWINRLVQKFSEKLNSGMMKLAETLDKIDLEEIKKSIDLVK